MNQFLLRGDDGGEDPAEARLFSINEIIRGQPCAAFHDDGPLFFKITITDRDLFPLVELLEDIRRRWKALKSLIDRRFPLLLRVIVTGDDPAASPGKLRKTGRLENQLPLFLRRLPKLPEVGHRPVLQGESGDDRMGRNVARIDDPGFREELPELRRRLLSEMPEPELFQNRVVEEGEEALLFKKGLGGRGQDHLLFLGRIENQLRLWNILQIEELKKTVEDVDPRPLSLFPDPEPLFGKRNLPRMNHARSKAAAIERPSEPLHLGTIIFRF